MSMTWVWSCPIGVWKYSALNLAIYFHIAFVVETWVVGFTLQRVKKKRPVSCQEALRKRCNTTLKAVQKRRRMAAAMCTILPITDSHHGAAT